MYDSKKQLPRVLGILRLLNPLTKSYTNLGSASIAFLPIYGRVNMPSAPTPPPSVGVLGTLGTLGTGTVTLGTSRAPEKN